MFTLNFVCFVGLASAVICASVDHEDDNQYIRQAEQVGNSTSRRAGENLRQKNVMNYKTECWNGGCYDGTCAFCGDGSCCRKNWRQGKGCSGLNGCDGFHCCVVEDSNILPRCVGSMGWGQYQRLRRPAKEAVKAVWRAHDNVKPKNDQEMRTKVLDEISKLLSEYNPGKSRNSITIVDSRKPWNVELPADYDCVVANGWSHFIFYNENKVSNARQKRANFFGDNSTIAGHNATETGHRQNRYNGGGTYCYGSKMPPGPTIDSVKSAYANLGDWNWRKKNWAKARRALIESLKYNVNGVIVMEDTRAFWKTDYYYCYLHRSSECVSYKNNDILIHYNW